MELMEIIEYWQRMSDEKWKTAEALMGIKRYADALFFVHLSLEAELKKAVVAKSGESAPRIHNLPKLALLAGLTTSVEQEEHLRDISTFNIRARYDDYKFLLYKTATREYAQNYIERAKQLRVWIQNNQQKKKS